MKPKTLHLYGKLAEMAGTDQIRLVGNDIRIILNGLEALRPNRGIRQHIMDNSWQVEYDGQPQSDISAVEPLQDVSDIHLYPVIEGSGGRTGMVILGVVLVVVGVWTANAGLLGAGSKMIGGALVSAGVGLILQGVFTPGGGARQRERPDERASFIFNGATNTVEEGSTVPLVYGRHRVGSVVASASLDVSQVAAPVVPYGNNPVPPEIDPLGPEIIN